MEETEHHTFNSSAICILTKLYIFFFGDNNSQLQVMMMIIRLNCKQTMKAMTNVLAKRIKTECWSNKIIVLSIACGVHNLGRKYLVLFK